MKWSLTGLCLVFAYGLQAQVVEYVRATWREDPSRTMGLIWDASEEDGAEHVLYYDTEDHGQNIHSYAFQTQAHFVRDYKGMQNTYVRLRDLQPGQRYYFLIHTPEGTSRRYWFETIPDSRDARLSFIAGGDSRTNHFARKDGNELVAKLRAHAVFFDGDMTTFGTGWEWRRWMDHWQKSIAPDGRITPIVVARGNHEKADRMIEVLFDTPRKVYYRLSFAGGLFDAFILNSEGVIGGDQTAWLQKSLQESQAQNSTWRFSMYHVPMRPHTDSKPFGTHQYRYWAPLFHQHNVQLVMEGDSHTVKTTYPIRPSSEAGHEDGFIRDDESGTVYIGEGTWGAPLRESNKDRSWTRSSGSFSQFKWIFVDREQVEIRTVMFEDVEDVGYVREGRRFEIPSGLQLWTDPSGEDVVVLENESSYFPVPYKEAQFKLQVDLDFLLAGSF